MRFAWVLTLGLLAAGSAAAQTPQDALKQVPDDAFGCILVNRFDALSGKLDAAARRMKIPVPMTLVEGIRAGLGSDKGLNLKGSAVAVIVPGGPTGASAILLAPVTDFDAFVGGIGATKDGEYHAANLAIGRVVVARRGMFAAMAKAEEQDVLKKYLALPADSALSKTLQTQPWAAECDLAGVVLKPAIRLGATFAEKGLKEAAKAPNPDPTVEEIFAVYRQIGAKIIDAAILDIPHVVVVGKIDVQGNIDVSVRAPFVKDSDTAKAFKGGIAPSDQIFAGLPDVPFAMAFGGALPPGSSEAFAKVGNLFTAAVAKNLTADQKKQLEEASLQSTQGIRSMSFVMGVGKGTEPLFHSVFAAYRVEDSSKLMDQMVKSTELTKKIMKNIKVPGGVSDIEFQQLKIAGKPAMSMVTEMTGLPDEENNPLMQKMKEAYFGPAGKMTVTMVALDKQTVFARYASPAETEEYVKTQIRPGATGLEKNKELVKTTMLFPKGTQFAVLVDMGGMMKMTNRLSGVMGAGAQGFVMPEAPAAPPFGMAGKITSEGAHLHLILPTGAQSAIGTIVDGFQGMMQKLNPVPGKVG